MLKSDVNGNVVFFGEDVLMSGRCIVIRRRGSEDTCYTRISTNTVKNKANLVYLG